MSLSRIFFYLLILFLPTQLGYHFWPSWSMVLGRRIDYLSPTVYLTDIFIFFIVVNWILERILKVGVGKFSIFNFQFPIKRRKFLNKKIILTIAFLIFVFFNIFFAASRELAFYKWLKLGEFVALGWYVIKTRPSFSVIALLLSIANFYSSIIAIAQFFLQHSLGGIFWWLGERTFDINTPGIARTSWCFLNSSCREMLRPYGTFPHPNVLAGFLASILPIVYYQFHKEKKSFYLFVLVIGLITLFITFSRAAWIVGLLALGAAILTNIKIKRPMVVGIAVVIGVFLISLIFSKVSLSEESVVVREQLTNAAIFMFRQSPLFGVGLGNFLVKLPGVLPSRGVYFLQPVHNIYLLILAETGILGILGVIWVIREIWKRRKKKWLIPALSLLLLGLVDHYPLTLQQGQLMLTVFLSIVFLKDA